MAEHEAPPPHVAAVRELALGSELAAGGAMAIPPKTRAERTRRIVVYVLMVGLALLYLIPLVWAAITSLKTQAEAAPASTSGPTRRASTPTGRSGNAPISPSSPSSRTA